jgi:hypothetical protein
MIKRLSIIAALMAIPARAEITNPAALRSLCRPGRVFARSNAKLRLASKTGFMAMPTRPRFYNALVRRSARPARRWI